jgi:hypothetical protein
MTVKCLHSHLAVRLAGFPTMMGDHVLNWLKENYKDETLCIFKEVMQS